jgi:hypothetical protein
MNKPKITSLPECNELLRRDIIPIMPFLEHRNVRGDKSLTKSLKVINKGFIPNTVKWCEHFKTPPPIVAKKIREGRWLFNPNETESK